MNDAAPISQEGKVEPRWLRPLCYTGAILVFVAIALLRDEPWTRGSVAGLVMAPCLSIGVFQVAGKIALGLHVPPLFYVRPPVGEQQKLGWLERPLGSLLQCVIVTAAAAGIALLG